MNEIKKVMLSFGFLCITFLFINFNITGNVILENSGIDNCSDSSIIDVWNSIFLESGDSGLNFEKEFDSSNNCVKYLAYKNNSNGEFWVISGDFSNYSSNSNEVYINQNKISEEFNVFFSYSNVSSIFINNFIGENDIDSKISFFIDSLGSSFNDPNNYFYNFSIENTTFLNQVLKNIYKSNIFDELLFDNLSYGYENLSEVYNYNYSYYNLIVSSSESFSVGQFNNKLYDNHFYIEILDSDIPDFNFSWNSDWNYAFSLSDYFNFSDDVEFEIEFLGDNSNGKYINATINGENISFNPIEDFYGEKSFQINVLNDINPSISSSQFSVDITKDNNAPKLMENFDNIFLNIGEVESLDLSDYFNDSDGDNLTYGVKYENIENVDFNFFNEIVEIKLENNFNETGKFRFYASDDIDNTSSNLIYISLNEEVISSIVSDDDIIESSNKNLLSNNSNNEVSSSSSTSKSSKKYSNFLPWIVIFLIIIGIIGILTIVYKIIISPKKEKPSNVTSNSYVPFIPKSSQVSAASQNPPLVQRTNIQSNNLTNINFPRQIPRNRINQNIRFPQRNINNNSSGFQNRNNNFGRQF